jgi:hypothetical protein
LRNKDADDTAALAEWERAHRIERSRITRRSRTKPDDKKETEEGK